MDWLDGPGFVAWLREHGLTNVELQLGSSDERQVRSWKSGVAVSVYTADRILVKLGLFLSEVPDSLWRESPMGAKFTPEDTKAEIVRRVVELGETPGKVGRDYHLSDKMVRNYVARSGAAA